MFICRWNYVLLGCLLPQLSLADTPHIDPHGESLYQQAVPYLQQARDKLDVIPAAPATASPEVKARAMALADEAGGLVKPAVALLEQAAALDHTVAQYRLGLIYVLLYSSEQIKEKARTLFERSLAQGFAPPALGI